MDLKTRLNKVHGALKGRTMKLHEAQAFQRHMVRLQDEGPRNFSENDLYELRETLPFYFQSGFCTVGVFDLFREQIRIAIYDKLAEKEAP